MQLKALVVDDDRVLADLVSYTLRREGFQVVLAHDGLSALRRWAEEQPDLVVLDVNLPRTTLPLDGFEVCRRIRAGSDVPVILLTVRESEDDIVHGLQMGADDYVLKPFSPRQLVARVEAVLRRAGKSAPPARREVNGLTLDLERREVRVDQKALASLTPLECRLLDVLMLNAGHILTTDNLISHIWGPQGGDRDMLRQLIRRLRAKIEIDPANPVWIETVPGTGYGFKVD